MPSIDLSGVEIHNSPDVRDWPQTATITRLEFRPGGVHVEHTKREGPGAWPNFRPPGWDGDLQYTLWLIEWINGKWHGSGGIQFWQACDQNGGAPEDFAAGWFYAADRWAPLTGHQPAPGDLCGFMVTAGDARNSGRRTVDERSNVVCIPFPRSGDVYVAPDAPVIVPPAEEPPPNTGVPAWATEALARLAALESKMDELGETATVVHVGAHVASDGRFVGPIKGTITTTGP